MASVSLEGPSSNATGIANAPAILATNDQGQTDHATTREGLRCAREGIVINVFPIPNWNQTREDVQFAHRLAESTQGRVFFTPGGDLDRYVVRDHIKRKRPSSRKEP